MAQQVVRPRIGHNFAPALASAKRVLAVAGPIILLCYAGSLAIATITFFGIGEALYAVAISIGFALIYFSLPVLMARVRAERDQRWQSDTIHKTSAIGV